VRFSEIFYSIQGESSWMGNPCTFLRLWGCNLRCSWCDTSYAYEEEPFDLSLSQVLQKVEGFATRLVEITGGEPLLQEEVYPLMELLLQRGYKVLLDTNGSLDIGGIPQEVIRIIDIKPPKSGMAARMEWGNMKKLRPTDEVKFVLANESDYQWAKGIVERYSLSERVKVIFSPASGFLSLRKLAEWILEDGLGVRLGFQLQKFSWGKGARGH